MAKLGKAGGVNRFLLISSAGLEMFNPNSPRYGSALRVSKYLRDVLRWKYRGEQLLRASGVPYTIVRAYSLYNEANAEETKADTATAVLQGDPEGVGGVASGSWPSVPGGKTSWQGCAMSQVASWVSFPARRTIALSPAYSTTST